MQIKIGARDSGRKLVEIHAVARFTGCGTCCCDLILGLAPQALCLRLLSQAKGPHSVFRRSVSKAYATCPAVNTSSRFPSKLKRVNAAGVLNRNRATGFPVARS